MKDSRKYERYIVHYAEDDAAEIEAFAGGEPVQLLDYSLGGFLFLSRRPFSRGETLQMDIRLKDRGNISLIGRVVRVIPEGEKYGIALDLTNPYATKAERRR